MRLVPKLRSDVVLSAAIAIGFLVVSLGISTGAQVFFPLHGWLYAADFFALMRDAHTILWGGFGILYAPGIGQTAHPFGALSLVPLAEFSSLMHYVEPYPYPLLRPVIWLWSLGIRTVIDLRTEAEAARGRFPAEKLAIDYYQNSLIDISADHAQARGDGAQDYIFLRYRQILTEGSAGIRQVFARLVRAEAAPAVFHCVAGKDRTGLVAAITLELLGVDREHVLSDYSMTELAMGEALEWLEAEFPDLARRMNDLPPVVLSAKPENLARVLDWLDTSHGGAEEYLLSLGLSSEELASFRSWMLE